MARQPRLIVPEVALHIVQRGVDRQDCFRHDTDRLVYLTLLRDLSATTQCALHAYCLMTNHVHLLLTPAGLQGPATLMRKLGQRYVPYFNRRYARTGTLWEGRFKSCLVDSARYVLGCYRYVEMNPVEAGMVTAPAAYAWSSHAGNMGLAENRLLTPHAEFLALASQPVSRHASYRGLFEAGDDTALVKEIREATLGGYALVGEALKTRLAARAGRPLERRKPGPRRAATAEQDSITRELGLDEDAALTPD
jgi:putative transposase